MVIDTESTNNKPVDSKVVELAVSEMNEDGMWVPRSVLINPGIKIPIEAMTVHHITDEMLKDAPSFTEAFMDFIDESWFDDDLYFVAHNSRYDLEVLRKEIEDSDIEEEMKEMLLTGPFSPNRWICTLRLAKHIIPPDAYENGTQYSLWFLTYFLGLKVPNDVEPHRAGCDTVVCGQLFEYLFAASGCESIEELVELERSSILTRMWPFGKHKGKLISETPLDYIVWALKNLDSLNPDHPNFDKDLYNSIDKITGDTYKDNS